MFPKMTRPANPTLLFLSKPVPNTRLTDFSQGPLLEKSDGQREARGEEERAEVERGAPSLGDQTAAFATIPVQLMSHRPQ